MDITNENVLQSAKNLIQSILPIVSCDSITFSNAFPNDGSQGTGLLKFDKLILSLLLYKDLTWAMDKLVGNSFVIMLKLQSRVKNCLKLHELF